jgi:hypothetical protein
MAPHRYRFVGFLLGFLVSDCSVGKFESQVGKKGTQVGKFEGQVGIEIIGIDKIITHIPLKPLLSNRFTEVERFSYDFIANER